MRSKATNENDSKAMGNMGQRAKSILRTNEFTVLYDKGFHTGSELQTAQHLGVETIVAIPDLPSTSQAPNPLFNYEFFKYNREDDTHTCPGGQVLRTNGSCTGSEKERLIHRSEYADYYDINRTNVNNKEQLYKRRQAIVEHPYGTLKRQWGFSYILTKKGIGRASTDVGFMFIAYNLRRIGNILTMNVLKEYLRILLPVLLTLSGLIRDKIRPYKRSVFLNWII